MQYNKKSVEDIDVSGKKVIARCDFNVPQDENGNIIPKIKISENVGKITNPHFKKVYRFYSKDSGMAEADYICLHDEVVDDTQPLEICDPDATWKKKVLTDFTARELLVPIFRGGRLVYQKPALDDIRAYCAQQLTTLWPEVLRFEGALEQWSR